MEVEKNVDELGESLEEFLNEGEGEPEQEEEIPRESRDSEEEEEQETVSRKRQRAPAHERIQEIQRERYQILNELERVRRENDELSRRNKELDKRSNQAFDVASMFYAKSAELKLENAKAKKIKARQEGDDAAEAEADIEMSMAAAELQQTKTAEAQRSLEEKRRLELEEESRSKPQSQAQQQPDPAIQNYWLSVNADWFDEAGERYDPELSISVQQQAGAFEDTLRANGLAHMIGSVDYFREIDKYVANYRRQNQPRQGRRELEMNPSRGNVAPVRNGGQGSQGGSNRGPKLSREEADIIKNFKIKPEDYIRYREEEIRDTPYKRGGFVGGGANGYSR